MAQSLPFKNERVGRTLTEESSFTGGMHYSDTALDAPYLKSVVNMDYDTVTTNLKTRKPFVAVDTISEDIVAAGTVNAKEFLGVYKIPVQNYVLTGIKTRWISDSTYTAYLFGERVKTAGPEEQFCGADLNTNTIVTAKTLGRACVHAYDIHSLYLLIVDAEGVVHESELTAYGLVDDGVMPNMVAPDYAHSCLIKYGADAPMFTVYGKYVVAPTVEVDYHTSDPLFSYRTPGASNTPSLMAFQFYALRDEKDAHTIKMLHSYTYFSQQGQLATTDAVDVHTFLDLSPMGDAYNTYVLRHFTGDPNSYTTADATLMRNVFNANGWEGFNLLKPNVLNTDGYCRFSANQKEIHVPNNTTMGCTVTANANHYVTVDSLPGTDVELTIGEYAFLKGLRIGRLSIVVDVAEGLYTDPDEEPYHGPCYRFSVYYDTTVLGTSTIDYARAEAWGLFHKYRKTSSFPFALFLGQFWKYQFRDHTLKIWFRHPHPTNGTHKDCTLVWDATGKKTLDFSAYPDALTNVEDDGCVLGLWFEDERDFADYSIMEPRNTCILKELEVWRRMSYNVVPCVEDGKTKYYVDTQTHSSRLPKGSVTKVFRELEADTDSYTDYISHLRLAWDAVDRDYYIREIATALRYYSSIFKWLETYNAGGRTDSEGLRYKLEVPIPYGWVVTHQANLEDVTAQVYYSNFNPAWQNNDSAVLEDTLDYLMHVTVHDPIDTIDVQIDEQHYTVNKEDTYAVSCSGESSCVVGVSIFDMDPYGLMSAFTTAQIDLAAQLGAAADMFKELRNTSITTAKNNAYNLVLGTDMYSFSSTADLSAGLAPVIQGIYMLDPAEDKVVVTPKIGQYVRLMPVIKLPSNYDEMATSVRVTWQYTTANTVDSDTVWNTLTCFGNSATVIEQNGAGNLVTVRDLGATLIENPETYDNRLHPLFMVTDETVLVRCTLELYFVYSKAVGAYERPSTGTSTVQEVIVDHTCDIIGSSIANLTIEPAAYRVLAKAPANLATAQGSTVWNNQLFLWGVYANDNTLFWSEVDNPCYFPYPINSHEFDAPIRSLIPYKTGLIAFTSNACYRLDSAEKGFTVTCIQRGLDIAVEDAKFIKFIKNMVLFKSGPYFYMVVPKATTYYTGELAIAPIYKTVQKFFDEPADTINSVLCDMYPEQKDYILQLTETTPWTLLDTHIEQDTAVLRYGVESVLGMYFSLRYDTTSRQWTAYFDVVPDGTAYVHQYELGNTQEYVVYRKSSTNTPDKRSLYVYAYSTEGVADDASKRGLLERYYIDTGYRKLTESLKKRFRELQFRMYTPEDTELKFRTKFYVDGMARRDYDKYSGELVEDGIGGKTYILTHNYLDFNMFATDTINPNAEGLEGWALDFSKFATDAPLKVRMACSGKGYLPRLTILSTTGTPFELSGINWVYRTMHGR